MTHPNSRNWDCDLAPEDVTLYEGEPSNAGYSKFSVAEMERIRLRCHQVCTLGKFTVPAVAREMGFSTPTMRTYCERYVEGGPLFRQPPKDHDPSFDPRREALEKDRELTPVQILREALDEANKLKDPAERIAKKTAIAAQLAKLKADAGTGPPPPMTEKDVLVRLRRIRRCSGPKLFSQVAAEPWP